MAAHQPDPEPPRSSDRRRPDRRDDQLADDHLTDGGLNPDRPAADGRADEGRADEGRAVEGQAVEGQAREGQAREGRAGRAGGRARRIPEATVARLPLYLRSLLELNGGTSTISSERLAELAGVNAAKVRKDLSYLGSYGTRGVGYDVEFLIFQMSRELGLTQEWPVVIVGAGNLGQALANYGGFGDRGFAVAALVDADGAKVGSTVGSHVVHHIDDLPRLAAELHIAIGIIATPAGVAQDIADRLVAAGITAVLNFAPSVVTVPEGASLRKVDLASELQILSFYQQRRVAPADARTAG